MDFFTGRDPAQLLFEGRNGKQLGSKDRVVFADNVVAAVLDKAVNQMAGEMVENSLLRAQQHHRVMKEKK